MICTKPNIAQAIVVSRFMTNLDGEYWNTVKRVLRGTSDAALCDEGSEWCRSSIGLAEM